MSNLSRVCLPANSFPARKISDMNEGIVEGSVYVCNTKHEFSLTNLHNLTISD